jgi:hypothetical protein
MYAVLKIVNSCLARKTAAEGWKKLEPEDISYIVYVCGVIKATRF